MKRIKETYLLFLIVIGLISNAPIKIGGVTATTPTTATVLFFIIFASLLTTLAIFLFLVQQTLLSHSKVGLMTENLRIEGYCLFIPNNTAHQNDTMKLTLERIS